MATKKKVARKPKSAVETVDEAPPARTTSRKTRTARTKAASEATTRPTFPMRVLPPLPPELTGDLPPGVGFADLAVGATFRYRIAVERGVNEVWRKHDERRYGDVGAPERNWYQAPEGSLILPV